MLAGFFVSKFRSEPGKGRDYWICIWSKNTAASTVDVPRKLRVWLPAEVENANEKAW